MQSIDLILTFIKGLAVGFVGAVPLGPLGLICIRRTLQSGFVAAVVGGLGTALADAVFGIISAFGLTLIAKFISDMEAPLRLVGGIFMLAMGIAVLKSKQKELQLQDTSPSSFSHMGNVVSNFFITITNPLALVFFTFAFASLGIAEHQSWLKGVFVVSGVFCGSMLSWIILSGVITLKRNSRMLSNMLWINRITGVVLIGCSLWALGGLLVRK